MTRAYEGRIESGLNDYYIAAKNFSSTSETFETLQSSFNIGETIFEIVNDLVIDYKNYSLTQIKL